MKKFLTHCFSLVIVALSASGCALTNPATVTGPGVSASGSPLSASIPLPVVVQADFASALANVQAGVKAGVIDPTDPLVACLQSAVDASKAAINAPVVTQPLTNSGAISGAVIGYVKAKEADAVAASAKNFQISAVCEQLIGHSLVLANTAALNLAGKVTPVSVVKALVP